MDKNVLNHEVISLFAEISKIPRESGNEKAVSDWIRGWAEAKGLTVRQDKIWDLVIKKPASEGYEDHPPVLMQAHIDMVCEKDRDSSHDFSKDPIQLDFGGRAESGTGDPPTFEAGAFFAFLYLFCFFAAKSGKISRSGIYIYGGCRR